MIQIKTVARRRPHGTGPSLCGVAWVPAAFPGPAAPVASASAQLAPRLQRGGRELSSLGPARGGRRGRHQVFWSLALLPQCWGLGPWTRSQAVGAAHPGFAMILLHKRGHFTFFLSVQVLKEILALSSPQSVCEPPMPPCP